MWIRTVDLDEADGPLREICERVISERGKLSDIMRVQSLAPGAMGAHLDLYLALLFGRSPLSRPDREAIAVAVSLANGCEYCIQHHSAALAALRRDPEPIRRFVDGTGNAGLDSRLEAILRYAVRLTASLEDIGEADVESLRDAGLSDEAILHVNLIASYFNYVNRIATGLGLRPSPEEVGGYRYDP